MGIPSRSKRPARRAAVAAGLLAGCAASLEPHDWSTYRGPGERHFQGEEIEFPHVEDAAEPLNRLVWGVNEALLFAVLRPGGAGYRFVVPAPARRGLGRAFGNLLFPVRLVNNLLQGELGGAWTETRRFVVNSTAGVLGLQDRARAWGLRAPTAEGFGRTLAAWGWGGSTYLMLPILGPSTVRDALGWAADTAADPATYVFPLAPARYVNEYSDQVEALAASIRSSFDPYELAKLLHVLAVEIADAEPRTDRTEADPTGATETLGAVFLTPRDPEFARRAETYDVVSPVTGRPVPYSVWPREEPGSLVYILPGLGGHRASMGTAALAEAVLEAGATPVTISSSMNFELAGAGLSGRVPGYLPRDARDVHALLDAIDADLEARYPDRFGRRRLGGVSLGGLTALLIAADPDPDLVAFDSYLGVNAPLSLEHGIHQLDACFNAPLAFPEGERAARIDGILAKALALAGGTLEPRGEGLPFTDLEARFLIGLSFRAKLRDLVIQVELDHGLGVLHAPPGTSRRTHAYREASQLSYIEYVYAYVLPELALELGRPAGERLAREVLDACDLRRHGRALAARGDVLLATNRDDFLLRPGDIEWARETLGDDRVLVFERGGHLGNLGSADVRDAVRRLVLAGDDGD